MNFDTEQLENALSEDSDNTDVELEQEEHVKPQDIDLDKLEKFRWEGKELTPKDLKNMVLMREDYTKKTMELSETRKYSDNLEHDLAKVKNNPALAGEFKRVYPEKYHKFLEYVTSSKPEQAGQKEVKTEEDRIARLESKFAAWYEKEVNAIEREIDAEITKALSVHKDTLASDSLKTRFEIDCITIAKQMHDEGVQLNPETWAKITKHVADDLASLTNVRRADVVSKQKVANKAGRDIAAGGGISGQAPKKFKSLSEAMRAALEDNEF